MQYYTVTIDRDLILDNVTKFWGCKNLNENGNEKIIIGSDKKLIQKN